MSVSDQKLIDLFYLKFDNANVLKLLKDKEAAIDTRGNFSAEELAEYISTLKEGGEVNATRILLIVRLNSNQEATNLFPHFIA